MNKLKSFDDYKKIISSIKSASDCPKTIISFCSSSGCVANKSNEIMEKFQHLINEHNLSKEVEIKCVGCFGFCSQGPFVRVYPDNVTYRLVKESDVEEIFLTHIIGKKIVDRLVFKIYIKR